MSQSRSRASPIGVTKLELGNETNLGNAAHYCSYALRYTRVGCQLTPLKLLKSAVPPGGNCYYTRCTQVFGFLLPQDPAVSD